MKCLKVMVAHFFDDFVKICREGEEQLVNMTVHNFFSLLGWSVSEDKDKEFGREFGALGIWISFERFLHGEVLFTNTKKRVDEVAAMLDKLVEVRQATRKDLERLRGRMLFAEGQLFGRSSRNCVRAIRLCQASEEPEIDEGMVKAINQFLYLLKEGPPRVVTPVSARPLYLFTDAAFENSEKSKGVASEGCCLMLPASL